MSGASHVFLSYNSRDRDKVRALQRFLDQRGVATFIDEHHLRIGQSWPEALERALEQARAVVVFLGAQIGNWQRSEIGFALDRQATEPQFAVIPVLLDGAQIHRSFLFLNTCLDLRGEQLNSLEARERLFEAVATLSVDSPQLPNFNPYRGLQYFDEDHAPCFFGRETLIDDLFDRVTRRRKKFVAVIGASGSGKSSVVRAGLIPRLRRRRPPHETWDVVVCTPGERPWFRLADALGVLRFPDKSDTALDLEIEAMARALQTGELHLASVLERVLRPHGSRHRLLLVIDQFEELFTLTPSEDRASFIERLIAIEETPGLVLMPTLRADFYGQAIEAQRRLSALLGQEQVTLGRLTAGELSRAVLEPARLARLEFDPGLPELLLRDAGNEPGNLPLLQHALLELYERGKGERRLTARAYEDVGGIRRAIATSAEREFQRFEQAGQGMLVRQVFTQLVRLARADEGVEDTRRRVATSVLPSEVKPIVDEFTSHELRLLIKGSERLTDHERDGPGGEHETVEVAHEALIREWDRLKRWLNEDRGFYLWRQRLNQALAEYERHGALPDYLLRGPVLKEAEGKLAAPMPEVLTVREHAFIEASLQDRERVTYEREAQQRRERDALASVARAAEAERSAQQQAAHAADVAKNAEVSRRRAAERATRISWIAAVVLFLLVVIASSQYFNSEQQRRNATALTIALRANALVSQRQHSKAVLLVALSLNIAETQEARASAIALLHGDYRSRPLRGHEDSVISVALSPDGSRIVSSSSDGTLRVWDTQSGQFMGVALHSEQGFVTSVTFSPDGSRIVGGGTDGTLRMWAVESGQPIGRALRGHENSVTSVAYSPDGLHIVSGSDDYTLRVWDAERGEAVGEALRGHEGGVTSVAFSPDGSRIVSGSDDYTLRIWDVQSGEAIGEALRGHTGFVTSVAFSPDGSRIVSGSNDRTLRVWDGKNGQLISNALRGHAGIVTDVSFIRGDLSIVSGSTDGTLRVWDARSGLPIGAAFRGHEGAINAVAVSSDGWRIVSGSDDGTLRIWDAKTGAPMGVAVGTQADFVSSVAFSPDGLRIVSGSNYGTLLVWDAKHGGLISGALGHERRINAVAVSPDGLRIVSGSADYTLRMWDARSGQPIGGLLRGHERPVNRVAFSPDGSRIISEDDEDTRVWDANSGQALSNTLMGRKNVVSSVASGVDRQRVAGNSRDALSTWAGGQAAAELSRRMGSAEVSTLSPDGLRIVSGNADGTLQVRDAKSGQLISEARSVHENPVHSVIYSPDGSVFVSLDDEGTLRLWDARLLESGAALRTLLCQSAHRNLTRQEWQRYVPEVEEYRAVCEGLLMED